MNETTLLWILFGLLFVGVSALDYYVISHRKATVDVRSALRWTALWIAVALGFSVAATLGTAGYLRSAGVPVDTLVAKVGEEGVASDAVELIAQGKVQLVVNTPRGLGPRADGQHIRMASVAYKVPCLTTLAAARAAAAGMADVRAHPLEVRPLQDLHPVPGPRPR